MSGKKHKKHGRQTTDNRLIPAAIFISLWVLAFSLAVFFLFFTGKDSGEEGKSTELALQEEQLAEEVSEEEEEPKDTEETEDPQSEANRNPEEAGAESDVTKLLLSGNTSETDKVTIGIDVSRFQGTIDWKAAADAGIDFAMIRVGYRTQATGEIREDTNARYNMQEATANGIQIGAYFF